MIHDPHPLTGTYADLGLCCTGAAVKGPGHCTCWEPIHDREQAEPRTDLPTTARRLMCQGCAYRPGSPENTTEYGVEPGAEAFYCHEGMRAVAHYRHEQTGETREAVTVNGTPMEYDPPIRSGRPYLADGTPAPLCAGWAAVNRRRQA